MVNKHFFYLHINLQWMRLRVEDPFCQINLIAEDQVQVFQCFSQEEGLLEVISTIRIKNGGQSSVSIFDTTILLDCLENFISFL